MEERSADIRLVLEELSIPEVRVVADAGDIAAMEKPPQCAVPFSEALRRAVNAFLRDRQGSRPGMGGDSPAGLLFDTPEGFGLPAPPTADAVADVLGSFLRTDPGAEIVLLTPTTMQQTEYRFPPEYGESVEQNWVFRIRLPQTLNILIWAVVDRTGHHPAYCYEIE